MLYFWRHDHVNCVLIKIKILNETKIKKVFRHKKRKFKNIKIILTIWIPIKKRKILFSKPIFQDRIKLYYKLILAKKVSNTE